MIWKVSILPLISSSSNIFSCTWGLFQRLQTRLVSLSPLSFTIFLVLWLSIGICPAFYFLFLLSDQVKWRNLLGDKYFSSNTKSGLLIWTERSVSTSKSNRIKCVSFWFVLEPLVNTVFWTIPNESLTLSSYAYSCILFSISLLNSFIMWLFLSLSPNSLHFLFCVSSIIHLFKFLLLIHALVISYVVSLVSCLKYPYSSFSSHFCFFNFYCCFPVCL